MEENNENKEVVEEVKETVTEVVSESQAPKKKNNKAVIYGLIAVALLIIVVGVCYALGVFGGKKDDKAKDTNKNSGETVEVNIDTTKLTSTSPKDFNGVYERGKDTIKIYAINDEKIVVIRKSKGFEGTNYYEFDDDSLHLDFFDSVEQIELYKEGIGFKELKITYNEDGESNEYNMNDVKAVAYKKVSDYTGEDVYKDLYGDPELLNGEYSGLYEIVSGDLKNKYPNGTTFVYVVQTEGKSAAVEYSQYSTYSEGAFEGFSSGTSYEELDENNSMNILMFNSTFTFAGDTLTVTKISSETVNEDEISLEGVYKKVKTLTMDDVLLNVSSVK